MNSKGSTRRILFTVKTFAAARELVGDSIAVSLEPGASVEDLREALLGNFPRLTELKEFAIARNEAYALTG